MKKIISAIIFIGAWYVISYFTSLPYPHKVAYTFFWLLFHPEPVLGKTLLQHAEASLWRVLTASFLAFAIAIPIGIIAGWKESVREIVMPIFEVLRPIPPLAWIPLAYILFAAFPNPIQISQLFIVFVGAFFPCLVSVFDSARNTPSELVEMARAFGADDGLILRSIVLPNSLQGISTGIRVGLGVGWMCIIAAEMVATSGVGLGYFIMVMYEVGGRVADIVAGIAMIGIIGYVMNFALLMIEEKVMPWR